MRQKDDLSFAELLNKLREGNHTQDDIEQLKNCKVKIQPGDPDYPIYTTHLLSTINW